MISSVHSEWQLRRLYTALSIRCFNRLLSRGFPRNR